MGGDLGYARRWALTDSSYRPSSRLACEGGRMKCVAQ